MKKVGQEPTFFDVNCKISQNQGFWAITASFFRLHPNKKKIGTVT